MTKRRIGVVLAAVLVLLGALSTSVGTSPAGAESQPVFNAPDGDSSDIQYESVKVGPFNLDPYLTGHWEDEGNGAVPLPDIDIPDVPFWALKTASFDLVDAEGHSLPKYDIHLHHFVLATVGQADPACPGRKFDGLNVYPHIGTGAERTPIALPDPYAMKVFDSTIWGATWHLMNMTDQPQEFWVEYTIGYDPDATNENTRFVEPWFMDVTTVDGVPSSCGNAEYDVPGDGGAGSVHEATRTWTIPFDAVIVGSGGHLHPGGIATELYTSDDRRICRSEAVYSDDHPPAHGIGLDHIEPCALHERIHAGEQLTLHSYYDNSNFWEGAMGINLTFFWKGDQTAGLTAFPDVPKLHPFFTEVAWGASEGITAGYPDGMFHPGSDVTRQAYVAFLHRMAGEPAVPATKAAPSFSDVPPDHPFHDAIVWAAAEGIVQGYPDGTFRPGAVVTRQAAVTFLYRMAGSPTGPFTSAAFSDVVDKHPFADEIAWGSQEGIVEGFEDGTFRPTDTVTRQAAMAFLFREGARELVVQLQAAWDAAFG